MEKTSQIRLAMLGMVEGNGHPYSWSAILNGYDPGEMVKCPFPAIPAYLSKQPTNSPAIPNVRVTHIWTDDPDDAERISRAARIPVVVDTPEDVIGEVDAVIIPTDKGYEHVERCRLFVEAGVPIFVDKPLVDNEKDLCTFCRWIEKGARIVSCSSMRYCKEYMAYRASTRDLGILRYVSITSPKSWERYGIHALEGMYPILGPGFLSVRNTGSLSRNVVHLKHQSEIDVVAATISDMNGGFGVLTLCGTHGYAQTAMSDTFYSFRMQLVSFIEYLRTGVRPFPFTETIELMKLVIAAIRSRDEDGREVMLTEIGE